MPQLVAAVTRDDTIATSVGSFLLLIFINLTGFVLNAGDIKPWWIWGEWPHIAWRPPSSRPSISDALTNALTPSSTTPPTGYWVGAHPHLDEFPLAACDSRPVSLTLPASPAAGQPLCVAKPRPLHQRVHLQVGSWQPQRLLASSA
jgi:hypothetical protein